MTNFAEQSMELHRRFHGKIEVRSKVPLLTRADLSVAYTPGVAAPCEAIAANPQRARDLTIKGNTVAIVTDGTAVLGLGNIGPEAALPVMEGKAILFKQFADIDAWPICLNTSTADEVIETVRRLAPTFGGINLEDIAAPDCFYIEQQLQDLGIPVFHDDQHGTAIAVRAAVINAARVLNRDIQELRVVICGSGAAGIAIAEMMCSVGAPQRRCCKEVIVVDSRGIVSRDRTDLNFSKRRLLEYTNPENRSGSVHDALHGADVFIGVSKGHLLRAEDIRNMAKDPIVFAMANPIPEIDPKIALSAGAAIVGTGRSDYPNQVNNVLVFPGIFRGALDAHATRITPEMRFAAARALADCVENPGVESILPNLLDKKQNVASLVAAAVREVAMLK
jgi:malate dehydrogenase (oxaloacetate-decarboxylating)